MKTTLKYILIFMIFTNCKAQNNNQNTTQMKTFDIETFEKNKNDINEYTFISKDSSIIEQSRWHSGYEETIKYKESHIQKYNKYYNSGTLKMSGMYFDANFNKGVWKEYDENGKLIEETDYDAPYKFTWEDILAFIKKRKIDMDNEYLRITRDVVDSKPFWGITYEKEGKTGLIHIGIDGYNGKIVQDKEFDYPGLD